MEPQQDSSPHKFWEFKKYKEHQWFRFQVVLLLFICTSYLLLHLIIDHHYHGGSNYEIAKLETAHFQQIDEIYSENDENPAQRGVKPDTTAAVIESSPQYSEEAVEPYRRVIMYIDNEFSGKWEHDQKIAVLEYLKVAPAREAKLFLQNTRFKVESNFWLIGPAVYWEIVFWSWFGVISSILFSLSLVSKNSTTDPQNARTVFDSSEIPSQIAKLLYAPLCTLVVVLGYNFFSDQIVDIESSKGVIVFAFIGGFYSSRLIALLDRLKEVVLPANANAPQNMAHSDAQKLQVKIDLELHDTITGELRNEIVEIGFGVATVTLKNCDNGRVYATERVGDDQEGIFIAKDIIAGKYYIDARWTADVLGTPVSLVAQQEFSTSTADDIITVYLEKSAEEG